MSIYIPMMMMMLHNDIFRVMVDDFDDHYDPWANRAEKSTRAEEREDEARRKFQKMRRKFEMAMLNHQKLLINLGSKLESPSPLKVLPSVLIDEIFEYVVATTTPVETEPSVARRPRPSDSLTRPANAPKSYPFSNIHSIYQAGKKYYMRLLDPDCHLTGPCWRDFSRHVRGNQGWNVKRVEALPQEKRLFGETRKGKVYFVYAVYTVPGAKKQEKKGAVAAKKQPSKKYNAAKKRVPSPSTLKTVAAKKPPSMIAKDIPSPSSCKTYPAAAGHETEPATIMPPLPAAVDDAILQDRVKRARQAAGYVLPDDSKPRAAKRAKSRK